MNFSNYIKQIVVFLVKCDKLSKCWFSVLPGRGLEPLIQLKMLLKLDVKLLISLDLNIIIMRLEVMIEILIYNIVKMAMNTYYCHNTYSFIRGKGDDIAICC